MVRAVHLSSTLMSNLLKERNTGEALCLLYAFLKIGDKQSHFVFYFRLDYQTRDYITRVLKPYAYRSLKRIKESHILSTDNYFHVW